MRLYSRGRGLDLLPAFGQVSFDVTERAQTQLSPDVCGVFFFGQKNLSQGLDLILCLCSINKHMKKN